jgi:hypothetical protein
MSTTIKVTSSLEANKSSKPNTSKITNAHEQEEAVITQEELLQFYGTEQHYKHFLNQFVYTDGVQYLAKKAKAYWLLDAIASHQPKLLQDPTLKAFQLWRLVVDTEQKTAQLICERDLNDVVLTQDIDYTNFPLSEVKLYLVNKVLLLPSEY